jgi:hypothetical protein
MYIYTLSFYLGSSASGSVKLALLIPTLPARAGGSADGVGTDGFERKADVLGFPYSASFEIVHAHGPVALLTLQCEAH